MNNEKIYWSIREVAEQTGLPISNIRYWEDQFSDFKDMHVWRDAQGNHHYSAENIRLIKLLKYLRDEMKITRIEAMKRWIRSNDTHRIDMRQQANETLVKLREELVELRKLI